MEEAALVIALVKGGIDAIEALLSAGEITDAEALRRLDDVLHHAKHRDAGNRDALKSRIADIVAGRA